MNIYTKGEMGITRRSLIAAICMIMLTLTVGLVSADGHMLEDFEGEANTLISYNGGGSGVGFGIITDTVDGVVSNVASIGFEVTDFGGVTVANDAAADWSDHAGIGFWFNGQGDGTTHRFELKTGTNATDELNSVRYILSFTDDMDGWQFVEFSFDEFALRDDGFNPGIAAGLPAELVLESMWGYTLDFGSPSSGTVMIDDVQLTGEPTAVSLNNSVVVAPSAIMLLLFVATITLTTAMVVRSNK